MNQPLSVTVVAGSPGTTGALFLEHLLTNVDGQRVTAIIPAEGKQGTSKTKGVSIVPTTERFKRLGQGCSCCVVRLDLMSKLKRIAAEQSADHVVIHLGPKSDLGTLAKTFSVADTDGFLLGDVAQIESLITVIDTGSFLTTLSSDSSLLLMERVENASMLAFDNTAATSPEEYAQIVSALTAMNPRARIIGRDQGNAAQYSPAPLQCNLPS